MVRWEHIAGAAAVAVVGCLTKTNPVYGKGQGTGGGSATSATATSEAGTTRAATSATGTMSAGTTDAGNSSTTADTSATTTGSTGDLSNEGLVVRYFVDDPPDQVVQTLTDSATDPLDLAVLMEGGQPYSLDAASNRGLTYDVVEQGGRAFASIAGTKFEARLEGVQTLTLEAVVDITAATSWGSRIIHIGDPDTMDTDVGLSLDDDGSLDFRWRGDNSAVTWPLQALFGSGRRVLHLVVDTRLLDDRVVLYLDGVFQEPTSVDGPVQDDVAALTDAATLELFNRGRGQRSFVGTGHYAAIYDVAMSPTRVGEHADVLRASDDEP